jgi:hypothetical protein
MSILATYDEPVMKIFGERRREYQKNIGRILHEIFYRKPTK